MISFSCNIERMRILEAILLGLVQGLTEFIPVSSSGHLVVMGELFDFSVSSFTFDVLVNIGTIAALLIYFRRDIIKIAADLLSRRKGKLGWYLAAGTVPAVAGGLLVQPYAETVLRSTNVVVASLVMVAGFMWLADRLAGSKKLQDITLNNSLVVGTAQALALVPGVSRSGITIAAGMSLRFSRATAARFSFLLAIPILIGATTKVLLSAGTISVLAADPGIFVAGSLASFVSGYLAISFLLRYLSRHGLALFVWYRLGLAGVIMLVTIL